MGDEPDLRLTLRVKAFALVMRVSDGPRGSDGLGCLSAGVAGLRAMDPSDGDVSNSDGDAGSSRASDDASDSAVAGFGASDGVWGCDRIGQPGAEVANAPAPQTAPQARGRPTHPLCSRPAWTLQESKTFGQIYHMSGHNCPLGFILKRRGFVRGFGDAFSMRSRERL